MMILVLLKMKLYCCTFLHGKKNKTFFRFQLVLCFVSFGLAGKGKASKQNNITFNWVEKIGKAWIPFYSAYHYTWYVSEGKYRRLWIKEKGNREEKWISGGLTGARAMQKMGKCLDPFSSLFFSPTPKFPVHIYLFTWLLFFFGGGGSGACNSYTKQ